MTDLSTFPVTRRWPVKDPSVLQLFSYPTPNGQKVSIMLEEIGLPYEAHRVTLADADVRSPEFLSLNPNNKIPAIIDPDGPDGQPLRLWESGAILLYLAEKTGKLLGRTAADRYRIVQWVMWQMGGVGPMFGQFNWAVRYGGKDIEDPRVRERFVGEARRLLLVLEGALEGKEWVAGDYSVADVALGPWVSSMADPVAAGLVGWDELPNVRDFVERFQARPAVQRGRTIPPR
jgi:GSH-dependent disulfide-bond oxidoreductase